MKICHVCKAECEDFVELCPVCGADLTEVEENAAEAQTEEILLKNPVLLASLEDVVSAEIFKDILKDNGIPFTTGDSEDGTMRVVFGGGFVSEDIYVDSADFETADKLYSEFLESETEFDGDFFDDDNDEE
ncbi:MAG: DUF2007 domain-containing protein [Clostridia bacterium]|nr:DUF2007 domain-containing protein [Clostridia bacterium]